MSNTNLKSPWRSVKNTNVNDPCLIELCKSGDLIEFKQWHPSRKEQHWAVYIGYNDMAHMWNLSDGKITVYRRNCDTLKNEINRGYWRINNTGDSRHIPLSAEKIKKNALSKVGDTTYNRAEWNCEHFARWCRYGVAFSEQKERRERDESDGSEYDLELEPVLVPVSLSGSKCNIM